MSLVWPIGFTDELFASVQQGSYAECTQNSTSAGGASRFEICYTPIHTGCMSVPCLHRRLFPEHTSAPNNDAYPNTPSAQSSINITPIDSA